jgi:CheY-like chemotaxis protein
VSVLACQPGRWSPIFIARIKFTYMHPAEATKLFKRFLIVEDNEQMRRALLSFVADLADEVTECEDGSEALALYAALLPDWVLMDIEMEKMDGLTATLQITSAYPDARIMIVSNHDDEELRRAARDSGACEYINKSDLLEVRRVLTTG